MVSTSRRLAPYRAPAFAVAMLLLIAVGVTMLFCVRSLTTASALTTHANRVIATTESIRAGHRMLETSAAAFLRTGDSRFLREYMAEAPRLATDVKALRELVPPGRDRDGRVARLAALLLAREAALRGSVDALIDGRAAVPTPPAARTKAGAIPETLHALVAEQEALLDENMQDAMHQKTMMTAVVVAGILIPLVLLSILQRSLYLENRRSRRLEREATSAVEELAHVLGDSRRVSEQRCLLARFAGVLQSCQSVAEAMQATAALMPELLPASAGHCYLQGAAGTEIACEVRFGCERTPSAEHVADNACWALRRGLVHRTVLEPGALTCGHLDVRADAGGWSVCAPLAAYGSTLGLLHVQGPGVLDESGDASIEAVAEHLSLALANLRLRESLHSQSVRDPLTGLFNRRYLMESLERELLRCSRGDKPLSVVMIDVDHFKRFNDQHGHAAGDAVLKAVGHVLQSMVRGEDIVCRFGGEEFTLVMPDATLDVAQRRAERIREAIAAMAVTHAGAPLPRSTASLGIATFPQAGREPAALLERADAALYRAKAQGRDRVEPFAPAATRLDPARAT